MATEVSTPEVEAPEVESPASGSSEVVDMKAVKPAKKHLRYAKMITEAIAYRCLKERKRVSSFVAIRNYLEDKYKYEDGYKLSRKFPALLIERLNQLTDDGKLIKVNNSYKLLTVKKHKAAKSKPRGRPPKAAKTATAPKPRGRPPKAAKTAAAPKPRGRPPKAAKAAAKKVAAGYPHEEESFHSREEDCS